VSTHERGSSDAGGEASRRHHLTIVLRLSVGLDEGAGQLESCAVGTGPGAWIPRALNLSHERGMVNFLKITRFLSLLGRLLVDRRKTAVAG